MIKILGILYPFHAVLRGYVPTLVHNSKPLWVVKYSYLTQGGIQLQKDNWKVYCPIAPLVSGREVWAVDNKRLGTFYTLKEALDATESFDLLSVTMPIHKNPTRFESGPDPFD